jgi:hypothetical protein
LATQSLTMTKRGDKAHAEAWTLDQLAKSNFFHRKLHEWKLLETADEIEDVRGENLAWNGLDITEQAWNKIIHRGIKPVLVFAHPQVLQVIPGSTAYYRMLALVSQKSMKRVGLDLDIYEAGKAFPEDEMAALIARHLNSIISVLIEADEQIDAREFTLWRGMAAGSQAQGSWQNTKGASAEIVIRELILRRLQENGVISGEEASVTKIRLSAARLLVFAHEPDIAIYENDLPVVAVEIKGGIDTAGVLERVGAALKSLRRARQENPLATTILILQDASLTKRAMQDLGINTEIVTQFYNAKTLIVDDAARENFFRNLGI